MFRKFEQTLIKDAKVFSHKKLNKQGLKYVYIKFARGVLSVFKERG